MSRVRRRVSGLMDEPPILVYPSLAAKMGINCAVIFQQLHFLINLKEQDGSDEYFYEDRYWVYNTYAEWQSKYFIWLTERTVKAAFAWLESEGLVLSAQLSDDPFKHTKWYTIDYDRWTEYDLSIGKKFPDPESVRGADVTDESNDLSIGKKFPDLPYTDHLDHSFSANAESGEKSQSPFRESKIIRSQSQTAKPQPKTRFVVDGYTPSRSKKSKDHEQPKAKQPREKTVRDVLWEGVQYILWKKQPDSASAKSSAALASKFVSELLDAIAPSEPTMEDAVKFNKWLEDNKAEYGEALRDRTKYAAYWGEWLDDPASHLAPNERIDELGRVQIFVYDPIFNREMWFFKGAEPTPEEEAAGRKKWKEHPEWVS